MFYVIFYICTSRTIFIINKQITGGVGIKQLGCMRVHLCVCESVTESVFTFISPEKCRQFSESGHNY